MTKPKARADVTLTPRGLRERELAAYTGISIDKIDELIERGLFPAPIEGIGRLRLWDKALIDAKFDEWSGFRAGIAAP